MLRSLKRKQNDKEEDVNSPSPSNLTNNAYYEHSLNYPTNETKQEFIQEIPETSNIIGGKNEDDISHFIDVDSELQQKHEDIDVSNLPESEVMLTQEDFDAAGIDYQDLRSLSESQIQMLIEIHNQKQLAESKVSVAAPLSTTHSNSNFLNSQVPENIIQGTKKQNHEQMGFNEINAISTNSHSPQLGSNGPPHLSPIVHINANAIPEEQNQQFLDEGAEEPNVVDEQESSDMQAINITITVQGHVKLTDSTQHTYFFSREELAERNINTGNLTDANITQIVKMAIPSLRVTPSPTKKSRFAEEQSDSEMRYLPNPIVQPQSSRPQISSRSDMSKSFGQKIGILKPMVYGTTTRQTNNNTNLYNSNNSSITKSYQNTIPQTSTSNFNNKPITGSNFSGDKPFAERHLRIFASRPLLTKFSFVFANPSQSEDPENPQMTFHKRMAYRQFCIANLGESRQRLLSNHSQIIPQQRQQSLDSIVLDDSLDSNTIQIGDELEICRDGQNEIAVVRYSRPGEFKVQYSDGKFAWIRESQVLEAKASKHRLNINQPSTSQQQPQESQNRPTKVIKEGHKVQILSKITNVQQQQRFLNEDEQVPKSMGHFQSKPILKMQKNPNFTSNTSYYDGANNSHLKRTTMLRNQPSTSSANFSTNIPGMRVTVPNQPNQNRVQTIRLGQYQQQQQLPNQTANAASLPSQITSNQCYCSLCDQRVPPSQMSFIVLRIMACNSCASEKISIQDTDPIPANCARLSKEPLNSELQLEKQQQQKPEVEVIDDSENFLNTSPENSPKGLEKHETQNKSEISPKSENRETEESNCLESILNPLMEEEGLSDMSSPQS